MKLMGFALKMTPAAKPVSSSSRQNETRSSLSSLSERQSCAVSDVEYHNSFLLFHYLVNNAIDVQFAPSACGTGLSS